MEYNIPSDCQINNLADYYKLYLKNCSPESGTFVEVGAYDGQTFSNTCFLADGGWSGIYIEPIKSSYDKCKIRHAANNVQILNYAIVDNNNKEVVVYDGGEWSTSSAEAANLIKGQFGVHYSSGIEVDSCTLDTVLENLNFQKIDLLVIDTEGTEIDVLTGFNLKKYRPQMCIIEMHEVPSGCWGDPMFLKSNELINTLFKEVGYIKVYSDPINTIFVVKENV